MSPKSTQEKALPGDLPHARLIDRVLRVDHAGEYGATRIYAGQLAFLKDAKARAKVEHMLAQEVVHLEKFEQLMKERKARPTALLPVWHVAGYAMGAATALMGTKAAMACTVAVESVINEHYAAQHKQLGADEQELADTIEVFRKEEMEHHDTGLAEGAEAAPLHPLIHHGVTSATRLAIWLSSRI